MTELVLVRAADEPSLVAEVNRLIGFLDRVPDVSLADVAYTCSLRRGARTLAIIASDVASLRVRLASAVGRLAGCHVYEDDGDSQAYQTGGFTT